MFGVEIVPPNGFIYPHPIWGSVHPTILKGANRHDLIEQIKKFRIDAGIPVGNPGLDYDKYQQELQDRRDGKIPSIAPYPPPVKPNARTLSDRITTWASNRYTKAQSKIAYVQKEEAERRSAICIRCPYNQEWEQQESCAPCLDNTKRNLLMLRRGNETSLSKDLFGCSHYGHSNKEAVWLPAELLKHKVQVEDPDIECWMKDL